MTLIAIWIIQHSPDGNKYPEKFIFTVYPLEIYPKGPLFACAQKGLTHRDRGGVPCGGWPAGNALQLRFSFSKTNWLS